MNEERFGAFLRKQREQRGWSQKQCAETIGISPQYLNDVERGRRRAGEKLLDGMGDVMGLRHVALYALCGRIPEGFRPQSYEEAVRLMDAYIHEVEPECGSGSSPSRGLTRWTSRPRPAGRGSDGDC